MHHIEHSSILLYHEMVNNPICYMISGVYIQEHQFVVVDLIFLLSGLIGPFVRVCYKFSC